MWVSCVLYFLNGDIIYNRGPNTLYTFALDAPLLAIWQPEAVISGPDEEVVLTAAPDIQAFQSRIESFGGCLKTRPRREELRHRNYPYLGLEVVGSVLQKKKNM